jgi:hypothetical protein
MVSATTLCSIFDANPNAREGWLDQNDLAALKTWLGRRYNRPAVPDEFVSLMRRIAKEIESCPKEVLDHVRSLHAAIDAGEPPRFSLYALTDGQVNGDEVQGMLAEAMLEVPQDLGILIAVESHTAETMTLDKIEFTYEVDASDITWGAN